MGYFEGVVAAAGTLTYEASNLLQITKTFENRLQDAYRELREDFTDEEIDENVWDEDFANNFAERLWEALHRVSNSCDDTIKDIHSRAAALEKALIWGDL